MWFQSAEQLRARLSWIINIYLILLLLGVAIYVKIGDAFIVATVHNSRWLAEHQQWLKLLTDWGRYPLYALFIAVLLYTIYYKTMLYSKLVAGSWLGAELLGAGVAVQILKQLSGRARPHQAWSMYGGHDTWLGPTLLHSYHSFPSGHSADITISAICIMLMLRSRLIGVLALALALSVFFSRIALDQHYFSDVLFGMVLGLISALTALTVASRRYLSTEQLNAS